MIIFVSLLITFEVSIFKASMAVLKMTQALKPTTKLSSACLNINYTHCVLVFCFKIAFLIEKKVC